MANKKDAYFFPHFSNARHDRKIKRVIKELGVEGYGIYFMLLEVLREQTDLKYPMQDIDLLADEFNTSEQKVRTVICNYQLFDVDDKENFFSMKLVYYLQPYFEKSNRARLAANKRWENAKKQVSDANAYANALPEQCGSNADAMQGENSKGENSVVNESREEEVSNLLTLYQNDIQQTPAKTVMDLIIYWYDQLGYELLEEAIKRTAKKGVRNFAYIESILKSWSDQGVKKLADIEELDKNRNNDEFEVVDF